MKWTYKCHNILNFFLYGLMGWCNFVLNLSWRYAHYRNGTFPYQFPDKPRLFFKQQSFWTAVKSEWRTRKNDFEGA